MDQLSQINLNERASIHDPYDYENIIEQQKNVDTDMIESDSETVIVNSDANSSLIQAESISQETQAAGDGADKKRKHWKEDEHRQFLKGLKKYQRGQWKEISKEFVTTRSPSQIASHAQKYYDRQDAMQKARKKRRSIHDTTIDNNGTLVTLPIIKQNENPSHGTTLNGIPSIEQQKEIPSQGIILNVISSIAHQKEIPSHDTTLNAIPSIERQKKISPLNTRSFHEQNEIPSHDTTLNDTNNDNLVTPPIEPSQGMQQEHPQLVYTLRTRDILPHDMENVVKMCKLLEKILKR